MPLVELSRDFEVFILRLLLLPRAVDDMLSLRSCHHPPLPETRLQQGSIVRLML